MQKKKIAVIGGGLGSISAIHSIMSQPNASDLYDITLYQLGWRLGGKGASGVNTTQGFRVEEHGIHFWFGFYENGFRMMKEVYGGLDRMPGTPLATFEDAFKAQPYMDFAQKIGGQWTDWTVDFPKVPGTVGDGHFFTPVEEIFDIGFTWLADEFRKYAGILETGCLGLFTRPFQQSAKRPVMSGALEDNIREVEATVPKESMHPIERHLRVTGKLLSSTRTATPDSIKDHLAHLQAIHDWIWDILGDLLDRSPELFRIWCAIDFAIAATRGIFKDGVISFAGGKMKLDFSQINDFDFKEWLIFNGADKNFIFNFPAVKSLYDGPFAFFRGAVSTPNVEAGTALNIFLRLVFSCKEHIMWRMQAGMGDTIFGPAYLYLKKMYPENIHFKFFHKATNLQLSEDKKTVEVIEMERQVRLAEGEVEYDPLVEVKGLQCWPSEPLYSQLDAEQARELQSRAINLETDWTNWQGEKLSLTKGVDFDEVIIGASLASLPNFCSELILTNPRWGNMMDQVGTVQTQAFQLWFNKTPDELGVDAQKVLSCYVEPLDTLAVMNQVLERENWTGYNNPPRCLIYVCGAFLDSETIPPFNATYFPLNQTQEVYANMNDYVLKYLRHIIPKAFDAQGNFDYSTLFDPQNGVGEERLKNQYFRANIGTSERYVYSLKGSSKSRLKTDESGFSNVYLTGDWIQNGLNIGFVEGAVISGIQTACAVTNSAIPVYVPW